MRGASLASAALETSVAPAYSAAVNLCTPGMWRSIRYFFIGWFLSSARLEPDAARSPAVDSDTDIVQGRWRTKRLRHGIGAAPLAVAAPATHVPLTWNSRGRHARDLHE